jgi:hypothetical protein
MQVSNLNVDGDDTVTTDNTYLANQRTAFHDLLKGSTISYMSKLLYNPSPHDVQLNNELFIQEAELKAKYKDDPQYRAERLNKFVL